MNIRKSMKISESRLFAVIGLAILVILFTGFSAGKTGAETTDTCVNCHEKHVTEFKNTFHSFIEDCTDCHGDASKHTDSGGIETICSFKAVNTTPNSKTKQCLSCHDVTNARFFSSPHGKASMDCSSCHAIHTPDMSLRHSDKICHTCHEDVFAEFELNERHRLQEGILGCLDCHNPHEPVTRERLGGFRNEACQKCHTDKGGPFIYEHGASRIEGCGACHEVHGSPNRHLLQYQNSGELCFSCHNTAPNWHAYFRPESTNCVTCHSTIHGSHIDKLFLK